MDALTAMKQALNDLDAAYDGLPCGTDELESAITTIRASSEVLCDFVEIVRTSLTIESPKEVIYALNHLHL